MSSITLDIESYQALVSRIEKLEAVLYGEVKLKLTELELNTNNAGSSVKKVTKKSVDEAKSTEKKKATVKHTEPIADSPVNHELATPEDKETTIKLADEKSKQVEATLETSSNKSTGITDTVKSTSKVVFTEGMNIMEYFKSNYGRYETLVLSIATLKKGIDDKAAADKKSAKKSPEEQLRSRAHNVWLAMRNSKAAPEADQLKIKELVRLIESERDKLKNGEKLGDTVSLDTHQKNMVELGGNTAIIGDDEVNKRLEPEDEN